MPLKPTDIEALVDLFARSGWSEMHLELDGEEIFLSTDARAGRATTQVQPSAAALAPAAPALPLANAAAPAPRPAARPAHWVCITAPNLGTYYRAPGPDAAPYVEVGDTVTAETEICLIEVMKLFTTVRAGTSGTVREITARDGQMVEYGQHILWIEPA